MLEPKPAVSRWHSRGAFFSLIFFFLKETTQIQVSLRIFSKTSPCVGVFRFLSTAKGMRRSLRIRKRTSCPGGMPGFRRAVNEGLFPLTFVQPPTPPSPSDCIFATALLVFFFLLCPPLNLRRSAANQSKTRLPTFPIRPDHPTNLSSGMRAYHFPPPQPYAESYIRCL